MSIGLLSKHDSSCYRKLSADEFGTVFPEKSPSQARFGRWDSFLVTRQNEPTKKIGGRIGNRAEEDERREAGLPESADAVFGLGFVPVDEEDGVHQCRVANLHAPTSTNAGFARARFDPTLILSGEHGPFHSRCRPSPANLYPASESARL